MWPDVYSVNQILLVKKVNHELSQRRLFIAILRRKPGYFFDFRLWHECAFVVAAVASALDFGRLFLPVRQCLECAKMLCGFRLEIDSEFLFQLSRESFHVSLAHFALPTRHIEHVPSFCPQEKD